MDVSIRYVSCTYTQEYTKISKVIMHRDVSHPVYCVYWEKPLLNLVLYRHVVVNQVGDQLQLSSDSCPLPEWAKLYDEETL